MSRPNDPESERPILTERVDELVVWDTEATACPLATPAKPERHPDPRCILTAQVDRLIVLEDEAIRVQGAP